jgi:Family of unknown function (DUF6455)
MTQVSTDQSFAGLRGRWRRFVRNLRSRAELAALPQGDVGAIARDIGMSEPGLRALRSVNPRYTDLMPERMRQLGLDPKFVAQTEAATYRDMANVCAGCGAWRRCARDLDRGDAEAGMNTYCSNTLTMDAFIADRRG